MKKGLLIHRVAERLIRLWMGLAVVLLIIVMIPVTLIVWFCDGW